MEIARPLLAFPILFAIIAVRYLLASSLLYFGFQQPRLNKSYPRVFSYRIQRGQVSREIRWSLLSCAIFAIAGVAVLEAYRRHWIEIYTSVEPRGWPYLFLSFFLLVAFHEAYFYFTHRWMHLPRIFPLVHSVHHRSKTPTPFASFSFHPWEAVVEAAAIPVLFLLLPIHYGVALFFLLFMTVLGTTNHLGFLLFREGPTANWFARWWIGPQHHSMHHRNVSGNFGLYFTGLDQLFRTELSPVKPGRTAKL